MIEQGRVTFDFDGTGKVAAQLSSALETEYEKIFRRSRLSIIRNNKNVSQSIILIVFGCFLLEAHCNRIIKSFIESDDSLIKINKILWDRLKRSTTLEKFALIKEYGDKKHLHEYSIFKQKLSDIIELRNKLAHYKDDKETLNFNPVILSDVKKSLDYFNSIPNPSLISELKGKQIIAKSDVLFIAFKWLKSTEKYYFEKVLKKISLSDKQMSKLLKKAN